MTKKIKCLICKKDCQCIKDKLEGYIPGNFYDIYNCNLCDMNFIDPEKIDPNLYDIIYKNPKNVYGYDKYNSYFEKIKLQEDPLKRLSEREEPYSCVYNYLKGKTGLNILEVGCGMGYMTYALNKQGNNAIGIDISSESIKTACDEFGNHYFVDNIYDLKQIDLDKKFDVIISTEVIEHMSDPLLYVKKMFELLKSGGCIIITTPNKGYLKKNSAVWWGDLPPVHVSFLSFKTFKEIGKILGGNIELFNHLKYTSSHNNLVRYLFNHYISTGNAKPHFGKHSGNKIYKYIFKFTNFEFIKNLSNLLFRTIAKTDTDFWNLGIFLFKK